MSENEKSTSNDEKPPTVVKKTKKRSEDQRGNSVRPEQTDKPPKGPTPRPPRAATRPSKESDGESPDSADSVE